MQGVSELSAKVLATKLAKFRKLNRQITQLGTLISLPANIIHDFREVMVQSPSSASAVLWRKLRMIDAEAETLFAGQINRYSALMRDQSRALQEDGPLSISGFFQPPPSRRSLAAVAFPQRGKVRRL